MPARVATSGSPTRSAASLTVNSSDIPPPVTSATITKATTTEAAPSAKKKRTDTAREVTQVAQMRTVQ